jgi:hypothetical protein
MDEITESEEELSDRKQSPTPTPTSTPTPSTEKPSLTVTEKPTQGQEPKKKRKRRRPLVPWKKPKDMPRRPLSAYNIFFRKQREAMMSAAAAAAETGAAAASAIAAKRSRKRSGKSLGIGFANLARTIAAKWKELDSESRAPYEGVAASEKERYNQEMLVWRAKQKEGKDKKVSASSSGEPVEALVTGMVKMITEDSTHSGEDTESFDASRASPLPVTSSSRSVSQPLAVLESPTKSSRLDYPARRGSGGFSPIRVPDLYGRSDPRVDSIRYRPRTYASSISGGMEAYPHHLHQSDSALGLEGSSYMEPWSVYMEGFGQGLRHHAYHLQGHPPAERRYTWSGAAHTTDYQVAAAAAQRCRTAPPTSATSRLYPEDAWFEAEATPRNTAPAPAPAPDTVESNPGSKLYLDTWFEVEAPADAGDDPIEPIRYSPGGDLTTGTRPPAGNKSPPRGTPSPSLLKAGDSSYDKQIGAIRSLNELASDTTTTGIGQRASRRGSNPIVENSLQTLELQLDEETVDFLTKLRFNNNSGGSNSEE